MVTVLLALLFLLGGTALLLWGSDWFIDGVRDLAQDLGLSTFVLALLIVGLEPEEMLTAAIASAQRAGHIALGDVIGTNVTTMTLALGLSAVISPIVLQPAIRRQALLGGLITVPALLLLLLGPIERLGGLFLLLCFGGYIWYLWTTDRKTMARMLIVEDDDEERTQKFKPKPQRRRHLLMMLGGLIGMALGGSLAVSGALSFTQAIGLGQDIVGGTIVALGTGAELLALGVTAARKGHADILVGGVLGSFVYNLLVTMGLAAVINPLPALRPVMWPALWLMVVVFLALGCCIWRGKLGRPVGWCGIALYLFYLAWMIIGGAMSTV